MLGILNFIQQVLSTPAIFVGLIALLGLALQKKDAQTMVKGTIKTILGFLVLNAGSTVVQDAIIPFGDLSAIIISGFPGEYVTVLHISSGISCVIRRSCFSGMSDSWPR